MAETAAPQTVVIARSEGEKISGTCKAWNVEKGYGFFACGDGGEDIFMHQSSITVAEAKFRAILPGQALEITYALRDGKATCSGVTGSNGTPLPGFESKLIATQMIARSSGAPGSLFGKVKWFNGEKGFGFIVPDDGSEDVFVNIKDIEGNIPLAQDTPVQYVLSKQNDGRDRASKVKNLGGAPVAQQPMMGFQQPAYNPYGGAPQPYAYSPYGGAPPSAGMKAGSIKWFNKDRGFGFIIPSNGGTEVYFRANAIRGGVELAEGDPIEYEEKASGGKIWGSVVVSRKAAAAKRKAPGAFEGYDPNPMNFKAPRQSYGQQPGVGQYDPYGAAAAPAGVPQQQPQYGAYDAYGQQPPAPAGYGQQPPAGRPVAAPYGAAEQGGHAANGGGYYPPPTPYY